MTSHHLTALWVKRQYTLVLQLDHPLVNSIAAVARFLAERRVQIESITVASDEKGQLLMVLKCHLEKDRLKHTMKLLRMVTGVIKLELIEPK